ncbi:Tol-Pal system protein TolB [Trichinella pseudospiralis]
MDTNEQRLSTTQKPTTITQHSKEIADKNCSFFHHSSSTFSTILPPFPPYRTPPSVLIVKTICLCFGLNRKKKMIDNMVFDEFLHSPLLQNNNFVQRVCLKEEKDYAEFKKEAVNFCILKSFILNFHTQLFSLLSLHDNNSAVSTEIRLFTHYLFTLNYGSFVGDALTLCTHTVYICISIAGESSWIACDCSPESLFAHAKFDW